MRPFLPLLMIGLVAANAPAAALTVISQPGAPDPGPRAGETLVVSFDAPNAAGYTWNGAPSTRIGSQMGVAAAPAGVTGRFGFISTANGQPRRATLNTPDLRSISFYWGSIDHHNSVSLFGRNNQLLGSFNGGQLPMPNGNWFQSDANRRVGFVADPGNWIQKVKFKTGGVAFEFDSIAASAVPEPASWAMLIAGFGLVGTALRRKLAGPITVTA